MMLILLLMVSVALADETRPEGCGECKPDTCAPPSSDCLAGLVRDSCGCCYACGRRENEPCGGGLGRCGEGLTCKPRTDLAPGDAAEWLCTCKDKEALCGADGRTYINDCQLTEARYRLRNGLQAVHRGPCRNAPKIASPPEDVSNVTGGNVALSCEVTGWPIPTIEWRVDSGDGDTIPLPSDDPKVAVQSRGGPSRYEVTGWLQLINIGPGDDGLYWCIGKNDEGESSAAARVIVLDSRGNQLSNDDGSNDL